MTVAQSAAGMWRDIAATFAAKAGAAVLSLVTAVMIARTLGPEGRGAIATATTLAAIGIQLGNFGLQTSNSYYLSRDHDLLATITANSIWVGVVAGAGIAAIMGFVAVTSGMAGTVGASLVALSLASIPVGIVYVLLINLLVPLSAVARFNQIEIGLRVAILVLTLLVFATRQVDVFWFILASVVAQALALWTVWLSLPEAAASGTLSLGLLRRQLPLAFRSYLASLLAFLLLKIDLLMVQSMAGNTQAGYYSIAVAMADMLYMLPAAAGLLLFPRLSAESDFTLRKCATLKMLKQLALVMGVMGAIAALLAGPAIGFLFGQNFMPAAAMFYVLLVAITAYGMNNVLSNHYAALGMPWGAVWVWGVALVVNIGLNLAWIPKFGALGAAFASVVGYVSVLVLQGAMFMHSGKSTA